MFAKDALLTPNESPIIDGYSFRILTVESDQVDGMKHYIVNGKMTNGFAVIASPVKYGDSGIMTFIIGRGGVVYQRDFGARHAEGCGLHRRVQPDGQLGSDGIAAVKERARHQVVELVATAFGIDRSPTLGLRFAGFAARVGTTSSLLPAAGYGLTTIPA